MGRNVYVFEPSTPVARPSGASGTLLLERVCDQPKAPANAQTTSSRQADLAKHIYEMRRLRDRFLPPDLLAEPGWDILLFLYWAGEKHQRMTVSSVCASAGVPGTTALRWIQKLLETGMLEKQPHPTDLRVSWLALSNRAKITLDRYLAMVFAKSCD